MDISRSSLYIMLICVASNNADIYSVTRDINLNSSSALVSKGKCY